jgi:hypothetical protein
MVRTRAVTWIAVLQGFGSAIPGGRGEAVVHLQPAGMLSAGCPKLHLRVNLTVIVCLMPAPVKMRWEPAHFEIRGAFRFKPNWLPA